MIARFSLSVLLAACVAWPTALSAQWAPPGTDPSGGYGPQAGPIQTAGGYAPYPGMEYCPDDSGSGYGGPVYETQPLPWERDGDSAFKKFIKEVVPNTYFRVEYLNWNVDDIGSGKIGSGTLRPTDPLGQFPFGVFNVDSFAGNSLLTPTTEPISFEKTSGLRATLGIPLTFGAVEFSGFALEENHDGLQNAVPGFRTIGNFGVKSGEIIVVNPGTNLITFPFGVQIVTVLGQRIFFPPATVAVPPVPVTSVTAPGDLITPNTIFNANTRTAVGIPLLQSGNQSLTTLIYDLGYKADYDSQIWGGEAKLILDYGPNHNGLTIKPLVGFRYMSFDESFKQVGVTSLSSNVLRTLGPLYVSPDPDVFRFPLDLGAGIATTLRSQPRVSVIDSKTENTMYGLQFGTRAEYDSKWFALGVEPRISLGLNSYEAQVTTTNLRSSVDGVRRTTEDETIFAPIFDVSMYGKVHVTPHFSLHAGYNFTYLFQVSRPAENIVYNDNGPAAPPGVVVDAQTHDVHIQGLTVGGEFRFRDLKFR